MFPARTEIHPSLQPASLSNPLLPSLAQRIPASVPRPLYGVTDASGIPTAAAARAPRQFAPYHQSSSPESDPQGEPSSSAPPVAQAAKDTLSKAPAQSGPPKEKPRAYIACQTCRSRKVRCDGRKPVCTNCEKRNASCIFDVVPRRRGPDKVPGTRQRGTKGTSAAKKRKRSDEEDDHPAADVLLGASASSQAHHVQPDAGAANPHPPGLPSNRHQAAAAPFQQELVPPPNKRQVTARTTSAEAAVPPPPPPAVPAGIPVDSSAAPVTSSSCDAPVTDPSQAARFAVYHPTIAFRTSTYASAHIVSVEGEDHDDDVVVFGTYVEKPHASSIAREPSLRFSQATWWDAVLSLYDSGNRQRAAHAVQTDLQNLFRMSSSWFSFINVPLFFSLFCHPEHRTLMQPSLVLGCLAYSSFMLGSEAEGGALQRRKSMQLRELAQAAFEASYNAGWIDVPLAQAAWVMALYEMSAHPDTSGPRMTASLVLLDNVIRVLGLTCIDADNPRSPIFLEYAVPALGRCSPEAGTNEPSHHPLRLTHQQHTQNFPQIVYHTTTHPTPFDSYRD
ncbi:hypothetical protein FRC00_010585, partial [Tulasnella sp. 408]